MILRGFIGCTDNRQPGSHCSQLLRINTVVTDTAAPKRFSSATKRAWNVSCNRVQQQQRELRVQAWMCFTAGMMVQQVQQVLPQQVWCLTLACMSCEQHSRQAVVRRRVMVDTSQQHTRELPSLVGVAGSCAATLLCCREQRGA